MGPGEVPLSDADEIAAGRARAKRLYTSRSFQRVYLDGLRARLAGRPLNQCPYEDDGSTWRRTFRKAWRRGWQSLEEALESASI